jgi:hypothetical protein
MINKVNDMFDKIQDLLAEITDEETAFELMCEMQELNETQQCQVGLDNFKLSSYVLDKQLKRNGVM